MKQIIVTASEIGKTTYCPHAHYLSTKHSVDRTTRKRLAHGNKMHSALGERSEQLNTRSKLDIVINVILAAVIVVLITVMAFYFD
jgi:hypothetical protein